MVEIKKFYDKCCYVYPVVDLFLKPQKNKLVKYLNSKPAGKVLEIGIGTGSHIPMYKNHDITGIDVSGHSIEIAKKRSKCTNVHLQEMNGEELEFEDNMFDYVVLSHVIAVTENPARMIEESYRVLNNEGMLIILNHETPENGMRYLDKFFNRFSRFTKISSFFKIDSIDTLQYFNVEEDRTMGPFNYFKLVALRKKNGEADRVTSNL